MIILILLEHVILQFILNLVIDGVVLTLILMSLQMRSNDKGVRLLVSLARGLTKL